MIILIHSETDQANIAQNLGISEYSYFFVQKSFRPLLEKLGTVIPITSPATEIDRIWNNASRHGQDCIFLTFSPPHRSFIPTLCPMIPIFAWEFDSIPTETWDGDPRQDWRTVLKAAGRAITHSKFAAATVRAQMGQSYPIASLPAPIWDDFAPLFSSRPPISPATPLTIHGRVFDSTTINPRRLENLPYERAKPTKHETITTLTLAGIIYTAILCPSDCRKNWPEMVCGFCLALAPHPDATLVLKLTHRDCGPAILAILQKLAQLPPFRCRILIIDAFLDDDTYRALAALTTYTVNTSHGEGQCLPLMEFLSAGIPAIAPTHTAMADYIHQGNAFTIESDLEPTSWPHDPRQAIRTRRHRLNFESLLAAFRTSFSVAQNNPRRYAQMAATAHQDLKNHCAAATITAGLKTFLTHPAAPQPAKRDHEIA